MEGVLTADTACPGGLQGADCCSTNTAAGDATASGSKAAAAQVDTRCMRASSERTEEPLDDQQRHVEISNSCSSFHNIDGNKEVCDLDAGEGESSRHVRRNRRSSMSPAEEEGNVQQHPLRATTVLSGCAASAATAADPGGVGLPVVAPVPHSRVHSYAPSLQLPSSEGPARDPAEAVEKEETDCRAECSGRDQDARATASSSVSSRKGGCLTGGYSETVVEREDLTLNAHGRNVFVFQIPTHWKEKQLHERFSSFGRIASVRVQKQEPHKNRGYGFVCFSNPFAAQQAVQQMNGVVVEGKKLHVSIKRPSSNGSSAVDDSGSNSSAQQKKRTFEFSPRSVCVFGIPLTWKEENVIRHFEVFGRCTGALVARRAGGGSVGYAVVNFAEAEAALAALQQGGERSVFCGNGKTLQLRVAARSVSQMEELFFARKPRWGPGSSSSSSKAGGGVAAAAERPRTGEGGGGEEKRGSRGRSSCSSRKGVDETEESVSAAAAGKERAAERGGSRQRSRRQQQRAKVEEEEETNEGVLLEGLEREESSQRSGREFSRGDDHDAGTALRGQHQRLSSEEELQQQQQKREERAAGAREGNAAVKEEVKRVAEDLRHCSNGSEEYQVTMPPSGEERSTGCSSSSRQLQGAAAERRRECSRKESGLQESKDDNGETRRSSCPHRGEEELDREEEKREKHINRPRDDPGDYAEAATEPLTSREEKEIAREERKAGGACGVQDRGGSRRRRMQQQQQHPEDRSSSSSSQHEKQHYRGLRGTATHPAAGARPGCTIFIFHVPPEWQDSDLKRHFRHFGRISAATVQRNKEDGESRGFAFVSFDSAAAARNAVAGMHGFHTGSKYLKVMLKTEGSSRGSANSSSSRGQVVSGSRSGVLHQRPSAYPNSSSSSSQTNNRKYQEEGHEEAARVLLQQQRGYVPPGGCSSQPLCVNPGSSSSSYGSYHHQLKKQQQPVATFLASDACSGRLQGRWPQQQQQRLPARHAMPPLAEDEDARTAEDEGTAREVENIHSRRGRQSLPRAPPPPPPLQQQQFPSHHKAAPPSLHQQQRAGTAAGNCCYTGYAASPAQLTSAPAAAAALPPRGAEKATPAAAAAAAADVHVRADDAGDLSSHRRSAAGTTSVPPTIYSQPAVADAATDVPWATQSAFAAAAAVGLPAAAEQNCAVPLEKALYPTGAASAYGEEDDRFRLQYSFQQQQHHLQQQQHQLQQQQHRLQQQQQHRLQHQQQHLQQQHLQQQQQHLQQQHLQQQHLQQQHLQQHHLRQQQQQHPQPQQQQQPHLQQQHHHLQPELHVQQQQQQLTSQYAYAMPLGGPRQSYQRERAAATTNDTDLAETHGVAVARGTASRLYAS